MTSEQSDATRFATRPAQRITELRNDHVRRAMSKILEGRLDLAVADLVTGMWKEWAVDDRELDPLIVGRDFVRAARAYT